MVPLRAASMEKGRLELLKDGGSMRRNGELVFRRLESRPTRLCFGEPREMLMGVVFAVFGEVMAFRLGLIGDEIEDERGADIAGDAVLGADKEGIKKN